MTSIPTTKRTDCVAQQQQTKSAVSLANRKIITGITRERIQLEKEKMKITPIYEITSNYKALNTMNLANPEKFKI